MAVIAHGACATVIARTPTLAASAQWAAPPIPQAGPSASALHQTMLELSREILGQEVERVQARVGALTRIQKVVNIALGGSGKAYLIGVVSRGKGCATHNEAGIYTRITRKLTWIQKQVTTGFCK